MIVHSDIASLLLCVLNVGQRKKQDGGKHISPKVVMLQVKIISEDNSKKLIY